MSYDYIKRMYGSEFHTGQRVTFQEDGREGLVIEPLPGYSHYVRVMFDDGNAGNCHPMSLAIHPENA